MVCVRPLTVSLTAVRGADGAAAAAALAGDAVCAPARGAAATTASAVPVPLMNRRREIFRFMKTPMVRLKPDVRRTRDRRGHRARGNYWRFPLAKPRVYGFNVENSAVSAVSAFPRPQTPHIMRQVNEGFLNRLAAVVPPETLLRDPAELLTYEADALVHLRATPGAVVLPRSAAEVQAVVRLCHEAGVPFVARGHGTGLSGGALPHPDGVLIVLSRLNRILDIDVPNLRVTVEPGVTNLEISRQVAPFDCYYAPDPSSQVVCSIGGNIAENSGGAHCLKYGFTVHHVLGVEAVLPDGSLVQLGG